MPEVLSELYTIRDVLSLLSRAAGGCDGQHPSFPRLTVTAAAGVPDALVITAHDPRDGTVLGRSRVTVCREPDAGECTPGRPEVCRVGEQVIGELAWSPRDARQVVIGELLPPGFSAPPGLARVWLADATVAEGGQPVEVASRSLRPAPTRAGVEQSAV